MRLRHTVATAVGALALALTLPASSASATTGFFAYVYQEPGGASHLGLLSNPPGRTCLALPEVTDEAAPPAHSPWNETSSTATVFTNADCTGDYFTLRPHGGHASKRLKLRSVAFS